MYANIKKGNRNNGKANKYRLDQISFYKKTLDEHMLAKPTYNIEEADEAKQYDQTIAIQGWAYRYGKLIRTLDELGYEFKGDNEGAYQRSVEQGRSARQSVERSGSTTLGDMQIVPNTQQENNDLPKE
jgi:carbonic anhydrase